MMIEGGNAGDVIWANVGNDTLRGTTASTRLDGGPGDDIIEGGLGNDIVTLWPGSGFDSIDGGVGVTDTSRDPRRHPEPSDHLPSGKLPDLRVRSSST